MDKFSAFSARHERITTHTKQLRNGNACVRVRSWNPLVSTLEAYTCQYAPGPAMRWQYICEGPQSARQNSHSKAYSLSRVIYQWWLAYNFSKHQTWNICRGDSMGKYFVMHRQKDHAMPFRPIRFLCWKPPTAKEGQNQPDGKQTKVKEKYA